MPKKYTKEETWSLYEKLPRELKEAIFAEETADYITNICERYDVDGKTISEVAKQVGNVLLGLLPPEDFQNALEEELKMGKETAKKIAQEINRFIFYPVKPALEQLYKTGAVSEEETERPVTEKTERKTAGEDVYREPVE